MSKNLQAKDANETESKVNKEQVLQNCEVQQVPLPIAQHSENLIIYDRQQLLVEKANNTFRELCQTLENEQAKLLELEERRKKLHEEMLILKAEIEVEKQAFNLNIAQSVAENLSILNNEKAIDENQADDENLRYKNVLDCYGEEETLPDTVRNLRVKNSQDILNEEPDIQDQVQYIRNELQNVLTECISQKCADIDE